VKLKRRKFLQLGGLATFMPACVWSTKAKTKVKPIQSRKHTALSVQVAKSPVYRGPNMDLGPYKGHSVTYDPTESNDMCRRYSTWPVVVNLIINYQHGEETYDTFASGLTAKETVSRANFLVNRIGFMMSPDQLFADARIDPLCKYRQREKEFYCGFLRQNLTRPLLSDLHNLHILGQTFKLSSIALHNRDKQKRPKN